jgi:hypothetical protein
MKKYLAMGCLLIFTLFAIPFPALSQDSQGIPNMALKVREFDFGKVKEGERIAHDFAVLNQGDGSLEIRRVSPG